ncbi:integrase [Photobacterium sp. ZSDE20]|uniref:Integrase n=1 Tax=Photobacterium pectinilyticum TaxID=2906793 RepID=A0ABT1N868_9GAMM|nr:integrase [Photobacterium sp. ZSDE20]MCQ1060297.1 integrase [Photobacterium sp. ZSDE20]MDD1827595.1 integrase [Photobacterium sp. ZSDE20]
MNRKEIEERFKSRNIDAFLKKLFPFSACENAVIAEEIIRLCNLLASHHSSHFGELSFLLKESLDRKHPTSISPELVLHKIADSRQLGVKYIPAFVASTLLRTSYDRSKFDQYKALTLISITRLSFMGKHDAKIKAICDEVRLFANGQREAMAGYLPDINKYSFPELVKQFTQLTDREKSPIKSARIINQLEHYHRPYQASLQWSEGYTRSVTTKQFRQAGTLTVSPRQYLNDEGDSLIEIKQLHFGSRNNEIWQDEDGLGNDNRSLTIVTSPSSVNKDYSLEVMKARAIQARIRKKNMHLPCDIYSFTNFEVACLVQTCLKTIEVGDTNENGVAKLLMLMLLMGNTIEQLRKTKVQRSTRKSVSGFIRKHNLPTHKLRAELHPIIENISDNLSFPLPKLITQGVNNFQFRDIGEKEIKAYLQDINRKHHTHITLTKVSGYLRQKLSLEQIDPVIIEIICGTDIKAAPALYYTQLPYSSILNTYQRYINFIASVNRNPELGILNNLPTQDNMLIGSPLHIRTNTLKSLFSELNQLIQKSLKSPSSKFSEECHNNVTLYTQLIMGLSCGYRPVTGWFGKLEHYHLATGECWISDKEKSTGDCSRVIVLPKTALKVFEQYLTYIEQAAIHHGNKSQAISIRYHSVLNSQEHLFFYREKDQVQETIPSAFIALVDPIFPLQPNWPRHHIRSLLLENNIPPELISAWMGHQGTGKHAFNQFSHFNRKQMRTISQEINNHLIEIGLERNIW